MFSTIKQTVGKTIAIVIGIVIALSLIGGGISLFRTGYNKAATTIHDNSLTSYESSPRLGVQNNFGSLGIIVSVETDDVHVPGAAIHYGHPEGGRFISGKVTFRNSSSHEVQIPDDVLTFKANGNVYKPQFTGIPGTTLYDSSYEFSGQYEFNIPLADKDGGLYISVDGHTAMLSQ